jgi:class 3 adenylate cyclase
VRCPSCGARGSDEARFCERCGAPLVKTQEPGGASVAPPGDGDRRVVTALFADLVDYVRMLAEHDPEVVRARVTAALAAMADVIERLGGTREKFIGDAVFAVFGWPRAHDDDAVRAALAGLGIRAALRDPGDGTAPLEVRVGIATGEVVAAGRPLGGGDLGLTGEAITTAARIQSLARPGEILLDGPTLAAARGRLAVDDRGSVVLRGQSTAVELHALLGETGLSAWTTHRAPPPGPLVGREPEVAALTDALRACADTGVGGTVVLVGDAGVGKSRILAAMEATARGLGFAWTWTENVSYGRGEPYRFARLFAQTVADEHGTDSGAYARGLLFSEGLDADAARRYGGAIAAVARDAAFSGWEAEQRDMPADPAEVASTLTEVAALYVERLLATSGPRVVVVDDLHWLDPSSGGMVELLVETAANRPLVVFASTRPDDLPSWIDAPSVRRVDVHGLAEPETAQLATLVARAALDAGGARSIHERTGGNPLFVSETVRAYLEDGTLAWRDGRVALVEGGEPRVPITLRTVLGARIDALDADAHETLSVASVIGVGFTVLLLEELLETPPSSTVLARLAEASLVVPIGDGDWRFAHALIRDAAYAGLLTSRRRVLHARLAAYFESHPGSAGLGEIAMQWAASGDAARGIPSLREAAASALALGAAAEAAEFWRQAATLAGPIDPDAAARDRASADGAQEAARAIREAAGLEV